MATSQDPTLNLENEPKKEQRNWEELNVGILIVIFQNIGIYDVLVSAEFVCRSWRKVAKDEPELWRRIDMSDLNSNYGISNQVNMARVAIDRSRGRLDEFWIRQLCDDELAKYLCDRSSMLKSLRLISCLSISEEAVVKMVKRQPCLEELQISYGFRNDKLPELIGKELPSLKQFKLNYRRDNFSLTKNEDDEDDKAAFGIAKTMHQLRHLQLINNRLSNKGLKAILDGCLHLETLDLRGCDSVQMDSEMRVRCGRLTTFRHPDDSLNDCVGYCDYLAKGIPYDFVSLVNVF